MQNLNHIGKKIRNIRKRKKISQEKLAELTQMNTRSIIRLENAQTIPTLESLNKISDALSVNIVEFFELEPTGTREELIDGIRNISESLEFDDLKTLYQLSYILYKKD